jgi:hypothetical protein
MLHSKVRIVAAVTFLALSPALAQAQHKTPPKTNPGLPCGSDGASVPYSYDQAVLNGIKPPVEQGKRQLITIMVGREKPIVLQTDGEEFAIRTATPQIAQKNIYAFLEDLNDSCRLPADPDDAIKLIPFKWESKDLTADEFGQLHADFSKALLQYVSNMGDEYRSIVKSRMMSILLDATCYSIAYDNQNYSEFNIEVCEGDKPSNPIVEWVHSLHIFAESIFHHPIWDFLAEAEAAEKIEANEVFLVRDAGGHEWCAYPDRSAWNDVDWTGGFELGILDFANDQLGSIEVKTSIKQGEDGIWLVVDHYTLNAKGEFAEDRRRITDVEGNWERDETYLIHDGRGEKQSGHTHASIPDQRPSKPRAPVPNVPVITKIEDLPFSRLTGLTRSEVASKGKVCASD